jgi:hypothetical protein
MTPSNLPWKSPLHVRPNLLLSLCSRLLPELKSTEQPDFTEYQSLLIRPAVRIDAVVLKGLGIWCKYHGDAFIEDGL